MTDNQGATGSRTTTITVAVNQPPTASAHVTPGSGKALFTTFTFDSTGSADPDGTVQLDWDFGDGSTHSTAASPTHVYATPGDYTATLTVTADDNGAQATSTVPVHVVANVAPTAALQVDATTGNDSGAHGKHSS